MSQINLFKETEELLKSCKKTSSYVEWCGLWGECYCSWEEFTKVSNFEYDNGWGGNEISSKLIVVGKDWWLERHEYDGSEWWEYKKLPVKPNVHKSDLSVLEN